MTAATTTAAAAPAPAPGRRAAKEKEKEKESLFVVFGCAVAVAAAGRALLRRAGTTRYGGPLRLPHGPARRRHVYGAVIFGVGFGLTGACPGTAMAMVATGGLGGLLVLAGLVSGMWLRGATERQHSEAVTDQREQRPLASARLTSRRLQEEADTKRVSVVGGIEGSWTGCR